MSVEAILVAAREYREAMTEADRLRVVRETAATAYEDAESQVNAAWKRLDAVRRALLEAAGPAP